MENYYQPCCDAPVINGICQECGQDLKAYHDNFSKCCGKPMIDGICPECLRTASDYRREQKAEEFNRYFGNINNRLKRIKTIK